MHHKFTAPLVSLALLVIVGCTQSGGGGAGGSAAATRPAQTKHEDIAPAALPKAVRDGFAKAFPGATIKEAEKETYPDGTVHYEIGYVGADGKQHDVEFNTDGESLDKH